MPAIYVPQGVESSVLSQIGTICVRGAYHTKHVLRQLDDLKMQSDPAFVAKKTGKPISPTYDLNLENTNSAGDIVAQYTIPASNIQNLLQYVSFSNIPFNHSVGVLNFFLNMFYPTDNEHTGDELGYYRQREWRLVAGEINLGDRPIARNLTASEIAKLQEIDHRFWTRNIEVDGVTHQRSDVALLYEPTDGWNFLELVEAIIVPESAIDRVIAIVGDKVAVHPQAK